jgi:hypothetical protein
MARLVLTLTQRNRIKVGDVWVSLARQTDDRPQPQRVKLVFDGPLEVKIDREWLPEKVES